MCVGDVEYKMFKLKQFCITSFIHTKSKCIFIKGDSNPNDKYVISKRALWIMNFDTSIIKIGWKMGKLWAFKEVNMANT